MPQATTAKFGAGYPLLEKLGDDLVSLDAMRRGRAVTDLLQRLEAVYYFQGKPAMNINSAKLLFDAIFNLARLFAEENYDSKSPFLLALTSMNDSEFAEHAEKLLVQRQEKRGDRHDTVLQYFASHRPIQGSGVLLSLVHELRPVLTQSYQA